MYLYLSDDPDEWPEHEEELCGRYLVDVLFRKCLVYSGLSLITSSMIITAQAGFENASVSLQTSSNCCTEKVSAKASALKWLTGGRQTHNLFKELIRWSGGMTNTTTAALSLACLSRKTIHTLIDSRRSDVITWTESRRGAREQDKTKETVCWCRSSIQSWSKL